MELARRVASELPHRPEWLALARENLDRWSTLNRDAKGLLRAYAQWQAILERPVQEICQILLAHTDEGQRLRQSSPFAGALTAAEVWAIKDRMRNGQSAA